MRRLIAMLVWLGAALWAAPALAGAPTGVALAAWVNANTDLAVSQVAIAGPDNVYSLEPLGPRLPTGEVLALVRTEAVSAEWGAEHQFQSWDAHMLFDCQGGRARVLRSASYAEHNRGGAAKPDDSGDAWFSAVAGTQAAKLLAAACDPRFDWPLRGASAAPSTGTTGSARVVQAAAAKPAAPAPAIVAHAAAAAAQEHAAPAAAVTLATAAEPFVAAAPANLAIQKANFVALPSAPEPSAPVRAVEDGRRPALAATAASAARTCKQAASAVRNWVWRRVEVAWSRHGERPTPQAASPAASAAVRT